MANRSSDGQKKQATIFLVSQGVRPAGVCDWQGRLWCEVVRRLSVFATVMYVRGA